MGSLGVAWAGLVLLTTVGVGVVTHELAHAVGLRAAGVDCTVELLPTPDGSGGFRASVLGPIATVTPTGVPADLSHWQLRVAALMPLTLVLPLAVVASGVLPGPVPTDDLWFQLVAVAWLGCALPSPQDFSIVWYPERALATHRTTD